MDILSYEKLPQGEFSRWLAFMRASGLNPGSDAEYTVMLEEDGELAAAGSRSGNILKYLAVSPEMQGRNLTATLLTELRKNAFLHGIRHLFLYTKPKNALLFENSGFYPVAETKEVLLLEDRRDGIQAFLRTQPRYPAEGKVGAVVANCNPFTLGHRYLIETAAAACSRLYVFVLSEDKSLFSTADRLTMVREGTADLPNVTVCETGDYLISSATFPDYFLKKETSASEAQCALDCAVFAKHFAPHFGITDRFVGSEPVSQITNAYNQSLKALLPQSGIRVTELPRAAAADGTIISASTVRGLLQNGDTAAIAALVPETTLSHLQGMGMLK